MQREVATLQSLTENVPDLNSRMPREEAKEIFDKIKEIGEHATLVPWKSLNGGTALSMDPNLLIEIMGSYRR